MIYEEYIVDESRDSLYQWRLQLEKNVEDIYNLHESLPIKNEKRIKFIMEKLMNKKYEMDELIPKAYVPSKNLVIGHHCKKIGDDNYNNNKKITAIIAYTYAIAYAEKNSTLLAISLDGRSKILYEYGMFESCIEDIQRINQIFLPMELKADYFFRQGMCHRALSCKSLSIVVENSQTIDEIDTKISRNIIENYEKLNIVPLDTYNEVNYKPKSPPILENENLKIPGLSNSLELNYNKKFGRYITAKKDILPGELIGVSKPYAEVVHVKEKYHFCWHCTKQTWNGIPCNSCVYVIYCSEYCREKSFKKYHYAECYVFGFLSQYGFDEIGSLTLRLVIQAFKECGSKIDKLMSTYDINSKIPTKDELYNSNFDPNKFSSFHNLWSKFHPNLTKLNAKIFSKCLLIAYYFAISIGIIDTYNSTLITLKHKDKFIYLFGLIERIMRTIVYNINYNMIDEKPYLHNSMKVNAFISPSLCFFNHQCFWNTIHVYQDGYDLMYSLSLIKKGEQVFSYSGKVFGQATTYERQLLLKHSHNLICDCPACIDEWKLEDTKITRKNSLIVKKIKDDLIKLEKEISTITNMASAYYCKNNDTLDLSKYIERSIEAVKYCHEHLKPYSREYIKSKTFLGMLLLLTRKPLIIPQMPIKKK